MAIMTAAPGPDPLEEHEREQLRQRRAGSFARALGLKLVKVEGGGFALVDLETGMGRVPVSGGCSFEEVLLMLQRRNLGYW